NLGHGSSGSEPRRYEGFVTIVLMSIASDEMVAISSLFERSPAVLRRPSAGNFQYPKSTLQRIPQPLKLHASKVHCATSERLTCRNEWIRQYDAGAGPSGADPDFMTDFLLGPSHFHCKARSLDRFFAEKTVRARGALPTVHEV
ncbi:hypothetical protein L9F63_026667, partial [Diploptera punctata]